MGEQRRCVLQRRAVAPSYRAPGLTVSLSLTEFHFDCATIRACAKTLIGIPSCDAHERRAPSLREAATLAYGSPPIAYLTVNSRSFERAAGRGIEAADELPPPSPDDVEPRRDVGRSPIANPLAPMSCRPQCSVPPESASSMTESRVFAGATRSSSRKFRMVHDAIIVDEEMRLRDRRRSRHRSSPAPRIESPHRAAGASAVEPYEIGRRRP